MSRECEKNYFVLNGKWRIEETVNVIYKFNGHRISDLNSNIVDMMHCRVQKNKERTREGAK